VHHERIAADLHGVASKAQRVIDVEFDEVAGVDRAAQQSLRVR
jgi:hypothetical protein